MVERAKVIPPRSRMGTISPEERQQVMAADPIGAKYTEVVDRDSAYEILQNRATTTAEPAKPWGVDAGPAPADAANPWGAPASTSGTASRRIGRAASAPRRRATPTAPPPAEGGGLGDLLGGILTGGGGRRQSPAEAMVKSAMRSVGSNVGRQVGNAIVRGVLGSILKR
jgi:hypothetical protein